MSRTLQFKRINAEEMAQTVGANGELIINTTTKQLTVHDGSTLGGTALLNISTDANIDTYARPVANSASSNTIYLQGVNPSQNARMAIIEGVNASQNIRMTIIEGVDATQNTYAQSINTYAYSAYSQANITAGGLITANSNTVYLQGALNTANLNIVYLNGALVTANANTVYLQGGLNTANANTIYLSGVQTSQNANIVAVQALANTDYTTLTASSGVYGNSTFIPAITLTANGRVSSITNTAITVGYTTGSGGVVTQLSSRTTGVTLNKPSGQITLTSNAMGIGTSNTFVFTNSFIGANDFIMFNHWSGGTIGNYTINSNTGVGLANVTIRAIATVAAEAPTLQYIIIKGAAS